MSGEVRAALRKRFQSPEWVLLHEVRNETGYGARTTYADAIALNCYPSRGHEIHGIEIKVSRGDWLRELKSPDKSAPVQSHCDRWWVAVSDAKIVKPGELPPTWGLLVLQGKSLVQKVEAPALAALPMTRGFVASMLRNATHDVVPVSEVALLAQERGAEIAKLHASTAARDAEHRASRHEQEATRYKGSIQVFEQESGIKIGGWDGGRIGAAVRHIMSTNREDVTSQLQREADALEAALRGITEALAELTAAKAKG